MNHWKLVAGVLEDWVADQKRCDFPSKKTVEYITKIEAASEQLKSDSPLGIEIHKKLSIEKGDVVVVRFDESRHPTQDELDRARNDLRDRYGLEIVLMALPNGFDIERIPKEDAKRLLGMLSK